MNRRIQDSGFTLIELAMVLFILGLLLTSFLTPMSARFEQEERNNTQSHLDELKEVIYGFAIREGRLPCPDCRDTTGSCIAADVDDGQEDLTGGECKSEVGNLPWVTLGIQGEDAWDQYYTYRVSEDFADATDGTPTDTDCTSVATTSGVSFSFCSDGDITIKDGDGGSDIATQVPAIIVSHGKNWAESPSAHEEENYDTGTGGDTDKVFVSRDFSDDETTGYDDMLFWVSPHVLRNRMLQSGALP